MWHSRFTAGLHFCPRIGIVDVRPLRALLVRFFLGLDIWLCRLFCFIELLCRGLSRVVSVPLQAPCVCLPA
jgi:hypothetical protein